MKIVVIGGAGTIGKVIVRKGSRLFLLKTG